MIENRCQISGCGKVIPFEHCLCGAHSKRVPREIMAKVGSAFEAWRSRRCSVTLAVLKAAQAEAVVAAMADDDGTPATAGDERRFPKAGRSGAQRESLRYPKR